MRQNYRTTKSSLWLVLAVLLLATAPARAQWTFHGTIAQGGQIDAVRGPGNIIHLVSSRYYQIDVDGAVLVNEDQGDGRQGNLDFPPAMAVGDDGSVHIVTRHGGDFQTGHEIRYRRRNTFGTWDRNYAFSTPVARNYSVGVAWAGPDQVFMNTSGLTNQIWGDLYIWQAGSTSATLLGAIGGIWRGDADSRMRGTLGHVYLVSGKPDGGGIAAYFLHGTPGSGLRDELNGSLQTHLAGSYRTGFPDANTDANGNVHFAFGAEEQDNLIVDGTLMYNQYTASGTKVFSNDIQIFSGLNHWSHKCGIGAVAPSVDGSIVVAVALRTDGSDDVASNSDLLWSISMDGGATWSAPEDTGKNTDGGAGRLRPRLVALGNKFFLFYVDKDNSGISMATLVVEQDGDGDGYPAGTGPDQDCDDGNFDINPGVEEICNGVDDNCDGETDEGCDCQPGQEQACGTDQGECETGLQSCDNGSWGECIGAVEPTDEICDGLDNNCDGVTDEGCDDAGVLPDAGALTDGGVSSDGGTETDADPSGDSSGVRSQCGCHLSESTPGGSSGSSVPLLLLGLLLLVTFTRRSRTS